MTPIHNPMIKARLKFCDKVAKKTHPATITFGEDDGGCGGGYPSDLLDTNGGSGRDAEHRGGCAGAIGQGKYLQFCVSRISI